jgi:hypothetical protein
MNLEKDAEKSVSDNSESRTLLVTRKEIFYDANGVECAVEIEIENGTIERKGNWPVIHGRRKLPIGTAQKNL